MQPGQNTEWHIRGVHRDAVSNGAGWRRDGGVVGRKYRALHTCERDGRPGYDQRDICRGGFGRGQPGRATHRLLEWNGMAVSVTVLPPPPTFSILGNPSEVHGVTNGSLVTPTIAPAGLTGTVIANGTGSVNFAPDQTGNGVYFLNCCANTNNAYYKFTGTAVGNIFNFNQGQISFFLTSRYNLGQRASASSYRAVLDVRDGNPSNHLITFLSQVANGRLLIGYIGGRTPNSVFTICHQGF